MPRLARSLSMVASLLAAVTLLGSGCAVQERVVVREAPHPVVRAMPASVREDRGPAPGADWSWVPGHWKWEGRDWEWVHGHWAHQRVEPMPALIVEEIAIAPSPQHFWVPGHWVWHGDRGAWVWVRGHWQS